MKNITSLTVLVIIILTLSPSYNARCQEEKGERNYGFSFGTQFGFINGRALEYVYAQSGQTVNEILSELIWDIKPVFYYGLEVDFGRINLMKAPGFFASLSFKAGVPGDSGDLEDRDWMSSENSNLTHFSSHTNKTREFLSLDAAAGVSIPLRPYLYLKPFISGSWTRFSFAGRDGYGIYARKKTDNPASYHDIDDNPERNSFIGREVINYTQDWYFLAAGVSAGTDILSPFSLEIFFQISPLSYCVAVDDHFYYDKRKFNDYSRFGLFLKPGGRFSFSAQQIEFSLEAAWHFTGKTKGESYLDYGDYAVGNGEAGAGLSFFDLRLLVKLRI
jgi:outer membrane protease